MAFAVVTRTRIRALPSGSAIHPNRATARWLVPSSNGAHHVIHSGPPCGGSWIPPGVIRLVRLKREGALGRGDLVATRRLGTCEVVSIASPHSLTVRALDNHTHYRISGIDFGTGAHLREV